MKKHSDIGGKEGENLTRQDFAADIIYHVIALGGANDPMGTQKGSNLLQKNGKTLEGDFITRQQPWTCTEKFMGPSGGHYGPPGPKNLRYQ